MTKNKQILPNMKDEIGKLKRDLETSNLHIQIPVSPNDLVHYIDSFDKDDSLPSLTNEQIMEIFVMTFAYIQAVILAKTQEKVFLEFMEVPKHLVVEPTIDVVRH